MNKRLLIDIGLGAMQFYRSGIGKAFQSIGYEVKYFEPSGDYPVLDLFDEFEPTLCLISSYNLTRPLLKALQKRPNIGIILYCPNWGDLDSEIDDNVLKATDNDRRVVETLLKTNPVEYCFTYYSDRWCERTHNKWAELGLTARGIMMSCDIYDYSIGEIRDEFKCDLSMVSGYWKYKAINLDKYILPMCLDPNLHVKLYGNGWNVPQCVGPIATENMRHLFRSTTVNANIFEPLSSYGFDSNERSLKVLGAGGFVVQQRVETCEKDYFTNDEVVFVDSPEEFREKVCYYKNNPMERIPYINRGIETIYDRFTYHHRARELAAYLGLIEETIQLDQICSNLASNIPKV